MGALGRFIITVSTPMYADRTGRLRRLGFADKEGVSSTAGIRGFALYVGYRYFVF